MHSPNRTSPLPTLFVGHGASALTLSDQDATHQSLRRLAALLERWQPKAILLVSAHWYSDPLRITAAGPVPTMHDHPASSAYGYRYPGHASAELVASVCDVLADGTLQPMQGRGLDHGAWIPLSLLHPQASLPVAQLSMHAGLDPSQHIALGQRLAPLRQRGVLLIGSGGLVHNQAVFRQDYLGAARQPDEPRPFAKQFDAWAGEALTSQTGLARQTALLDMPNHPLAAEAHPTIDHWLPLLVTVGAAFDEPATRLFEGWQHSLSTSAFALGDAV